MKTLTFGAVLAIAAANSFRELLRALAAIDVQSFK